MRKKVSLKKLRELLKKRPKPRIVDGRMVFDHLLAEQYQKWIEEFTEAFNQFEKQLVKEIVGWKADYSQIMTIEESLEKERKKRMCKK